MSGRTIQEAGLSEILPGSLARDDNLLAIAQALDGPIRALPVVIWAAAWQDHIDDLTSKQCDFIADAWFEHFWSRDFPLNVKHKILHNAWKRKFQSGTPYWIKDILQTLGFDSVDLIENPMSFGEQQTGTFEVRLDDQPMDINTQRIVNRAILSTRPYTRTHTFNNRLHCEAESFQGAGCRYATWYRVDWATSFDPNFGTQLIGDEEEVGGLLSIGNIPQSAPVGLIPAQQEEGGILTRGVVQQGTALTLLQDNTEDSGLITVDQ